MKELKAIASSLLIEHLTDALKARIDGLLRAGASKKKILALFKESVLRQREGQQGQLTLLAVKTYLGIELE